jgi:hypothetical protein
MLVVASRQRRDLKLYDFGKRWLGRGLYYFERVGLPELEEEQQQTYQEVRGQVQPYLERFDQVTTQQFLPALSDGQQALVVDAQMATKQWHNEQPEAEEPLPLPSPALVLGVSDAAKLETAAKQYFQLAQEVMDRLHQQSPDEIPEIKIPAPSKREFSAGMIYYYSAPAEAGLHRWLAPNSGLSQQYLVLSVLPQQTQRLLQSNPLQATGPLSDPTRPLAVAVHIDFTAAIDALKPWLRFGLKLARENAEEAVDQQVLLQMIETQSTEAFEILRCVNSYTAATYQDSEAMVTHFQWRLKDLP